MKASVDGMKTARLRRLATAVGDEGWRRRRELHAAQVSGQRGVGVGVGVGWLSAQPVTLVKATGRGPRLVECQPSTQIALAQRYDGLHPSCSLTRDASLDPLFGCAALVYTEPKVPRSRIPSGYDLTS